MSNKIVSAIIGLAVGDALGVPVEFYDRYTLDKNPVFEMLGYRTYNQPKGTWSDDTSLTIALVESLSRGLDYTDIMNNFINWYNDAKFTAHNKVFDIGIATNESLERYQAGMQPILCGGSSEYDNGNGSLMRIIPILFYLQSVYGNSFQDYDDAFEIIHNVSSLTHRHKRSHIACGIYVSVANELMNSKDLVMSVAKGIKNAKTFYTKNEEYKDDLKHFNRVETDILKNINRDDINSGGYVVHTLEAALWAMLNTDSYQTCVLAAVNLASDSDTTGAVAGALAGLYYGYDSMPQKWLNVLVGREYIEDLCNDLNNKLEISKKVYL